MSETAKAEAKGEGAEASATTGQKDHNAQQSGGEVTGERDHNQEQTAGGDPTGDRKSADEKQADEE